MFTLEDCILKIQQHGNSSYVIIYTFIYTHLRPLHKTITQYKSRVTTEVTSMDNKCNNINSRRNIIFLVTLHDRQRPELDILIGIPYT